jgi:hypothetical protein
MARVVPTSITASGIASKLMDEWGGIWTQKTHNPPERETEREREKGSINLILQEANQPNKKQNPKWH